MLNLRSALLAAQLSALFLVCLEAPASAIPAFARAYKVPCSTCHTAITRRNEFGDAFRKLGYRWPGPREIDQEAREPIVMPGVSAMRALLPAQLPLALTATISGSWSNDRNVPTNPVLGSPALRLVMGNALGDHLAFFGKWDGQGQPDELYLHVSRIINDRPELNARIGVLEQTTTLFKDNEALLSTFLITSSGLNGHVVGRGRIGAEANGVVLGRTFWAAGVVQNSGVGSNFDTYYHLSQRIGGRSFLGDPRSVSPDDPCFWDRWSVTLGHWGYFGRVPGPLGENIARVRRFGLDAKISFDKLSLWGGVMVGLDRNLTVYVDAHNVTGFAELSVPITSWLIPMYSYQYQDSATLMRPVQIHDIGVIVLPIENMRVRIKFNVADDNRKDEALDLQVFFAF